MGEFKEVDGYWNPPRRPEDLSGVNVVTPVQPKNTCAHISANSLTVIQTTFKRGLENIPNWEIFFEKIDHSVYYNFFVIASGSVSNPEQLEQWKGLIKSQLVKLLHSLENLLGKCQISPECKTEGLQFEWTIGIEQMNNLKDLDLLLKQFETQLLNRAVSFKTSA